jgi:hypothetical protein
MASYGKNIKQLPQRATPELSDFMYIVAGDSDYNVSLEKLAALFGIEEVEGWQTVTAESGGMAFIDTEEYTTYAIVKLEYLMRRGSGGGRGYRSGTLTMIYTSLVGGGIRIVDVYDYPLEDDLGVQLTGTASSGIMRLQITADSSDSNDTIFNYKIIRRKPITIS